MTAHLIILAAVEHHLSQCGYFCLIDWLLDENRLDYTAYEQWRYGSLAMLDEALDLDRQALLSLISEVRDFAADLSLQAQEQEFHPWDTARSIPLCASNVKEIDIGLRQQWRRVQDIPQMDLFMDNTAIVLENTLLDRLVARQFDVAQDQLDKLIGLNPRHKKLGAYQDLINYGQHMLASATIDANAVEEELHGLEQEVVPLARETLSQARDYLAFAWRRISTNLEHIAFDPVRPNVHSSYCLMHIPDYQAAKRVLHAQETLYDHPVLMLRLAQCYEQLHADSDAMMLWCLMFERDATFAEQSVEANHSKLIGTLWQKFWETEAEQTRDDFAAFVLMVRPGILRHLDQFAALQSERNCATVELLQARIQGKDQMRARKNLHAVSPPLLRIFLTRFTA